MKSYSVIFSRIVHPEERVNVLKDTYGFSESFRVEYLQEKGKIARKTLQKEESCQNPQKHLTNKIIYYKHDCPLS